MKKRKFSLILMTCILMVSLLAGCSGGKLSDKFDEATVKSEAERLITCFFNEDYKGIIDAFPEELQSQTTEEDWKTVKDTYASQQGAFKSFSKEVLSSQHDDATDTDTAFIIVIAECENADIQFTLSFNEEMELTNFFLK